MRISDWSSDVCSSDLSHAGPVCFFLYLPACSGLGLLGTECVACFNVARHRSTSFYCHRNGGVPAYAGHGADIDSGLDAPSGPWLAASRSEERRVGQECGSTGSSGGSRFHLHKKKKTQT